MNKKFTIYHNPHCSKSRATLEILQNHTSDIEVIEYLKDPPTSDRLSELIGQLGIRAKELLRTKEKIFEELELNIEDDTAVLAAIQKHPQLMERPLVSDGQRAVLGRPPENVLQLF